MATLSRRLVRNVNHAVDCTATDGLILTNRADANAEDMLGNAFSATDSVSTTIHAPVLTLDKTATASVAAGEAITYRLTYENTGSGGATLLWWTSCRQALTTATH